MADSTTNSWWSRKVLTIIVLPCLAATVLAGVSVFKGWLHHRAGFDGEGNPLVKAPDPKKQPIPPKPRAVISATDACKHIVADLKRRDPETRSRLRYLTLRHRHNEPTCTDAELETDRRAVRELTALLSHGRAGSAEFIDPEQILFRIDLQDFDWTAATDWHKVASQYRYGIGGTEPLAKLRQQINELTDDALPVVRADWFVVVLTRPPLAGPNGLLRTPLTTLPEAVQTLARQYPAQTLDLAACVRELDFGDEKALADLIRTQENLQQEFGLAPLLRGERIRREWWESDRNFFSPYQEVARLLKIGPPVRVQ